MARLFFNIGASGRKTSVNGTHPSITAQNLPFTDVGKNSPFWVDRVRSQAYIKDTVKTGTGIPAEGLNRVGWAVGRLGAQLQLA